MLLRGISALCERAAFDQVVEGVAEHARNIKVGPGMEPDTQMGPLVSEEQFAAGLQLP